MRDPKQLGDRKRGNKSYITLFSLQFIWGYGEIVKGIRGWLRGRKHKKGKRFPLAPGNQKINRFCFVSDPGQWVAIQGWHLDWGWKGDNRNLKLINQVLVKEDQTHPESTKGNGSDCSQEHENVTRESNLLTPPTSTPEPTSRLRLLTAEDRKPQSDPTGHNTASPSFHPVLPFFRW